MTKTGDCSFLGELPYDAYWWDACSALSPETVCVLENA